MLRRTSARLYFIPEQFSKTQFNPWTPEIRMLDKDEKIPEVDPRMKMGMGAYQPELVWPPMDPLNPTYEQKRASNTGSQGYFFASRVLPPYKTGFRTVPPELVDWRSTFYGDPFEELPYLNEKLYYAHPEYSFAGNIYTGKEWVAHNDAQPTNIEDASLSVQVHPKIDAWQRWQANKCVRNWRFTPTKWWMLVIWLFAAAWLSKSHWAQLESRFRTTRLFWDGMYAGTYKYGGYRGHSFAQTGTGGGGLYIV